MEVHTLARLVQLLACSSHTKWYLISPSEHITCPEVPCKTSHTHSKCLHVHWGSSKPRRHQSCISCAASSASMSLPVHMLTPHQPPCVCQPTNNAWHWVLYHTAWLPANTHSLVPLLESLIAMNWCTSLCSRSHLLGRGRECMQMLWEQCCCVVGCGHLVEEGLGVGPWSVECWTLIIDDVMLSQSCAKITSLSDMTNKGVWRPSDIFSFSKLTTIYKSCNRDCTWQYLKLNLHWTGSKWSLGSVTYDSYMGLPFEPVINKEPEVLEVLWWPHHVIGGVLLIW